MSSDSTDRLEDAPSETPVARAATMQADNVIDLASKIDLQLGAATDALTDLAVDSVTKPESWVEKGRSSNLDECKMRLRTTTYTRRMTTLKLSINDQLTKIYVYVDDYLKAHPGRAQWRRSNNKQPALSDAEVITSALMQGYFGCSTLAHTYALVRANEGRAFPHLCGYKQWLARLHQVSSLIGQMVEAARRDHPETAIYLLDSKPLPMCLGLRHGRVRLLREAGAHFGKTSKGWFFGFKLHLLTDLTGCIIGAVLTPGNWSDRDVAPALAEFVEGGIAIGDLGYRGEELAHLLAEQTGLLLLTRADVEARKALLASVRARIETTFSQLWNQFIDRIFSRSWNGLWNTVKLKMLYFNLLHVGLITA